MKAKLKVIKNWEFEEFELTGTSFKYSPTGCKGMVARSEDEIVFWTYHLVQKCSGVLFLQIQPDWMQRYGSPQRG